MTHGCPCAYGATDEALRHRIFSRAWYTGHKAHHLSVFPNVDARTIEVLDELIERAA